MVEVMKHFKNYLSYMCLIWLLKGMVCQDSFLASHALNIS